MGGAWHWAAPDDYRAQCSLSTREHTKVVGSSRAAKLSQREGIGMSASSRIYPVARIKRLHDSGLDLENLLAAMNTNFALTKYGSKTVVACIDGNDVDFMIDQDFHKMFSNVTVQREVKKEDGSTSTRRVRLSRCWFDWPGRRQYLGRGAVFEPGGPPQIQGDMLNIWRGLGVEPKQGDWSLMRSHMFDVLCSGNQKHFDYLIQLMAWGVQHLDKPLGVAVAFLGPQGAGKGVVARTYGRFYGKHFSHITHGDQLTGRFNAGIGTSCAIFLDEAVWAADRKGEGTLKALITEPTLQLEAKFRDPIMVQNRLRIMVASNSEWAVPAGIGDRRWFVLHVANTYAGTKHQAYWDALYAQLHDGGEAALLYDLLNMDLNEFNVRDIPNTAAKAQQQVHSLQGARAWLHDVLQEGSISGEQWQGAGLTIETDRAYMCYVEFSRRQRDWKPEIKSVWSKNIQAALGLHIQTTRPTKGNTRVRSFQFGPLDDCRRQFGAHLCAPDLEWEGQPDEQADEPPEGMRDCDDASLDVVDEDGETETDPEQECEKEDRSPD
jgi:hypothetical protein